MAGVFDQITGRTQTDDEPDTGDNTRSAETSQDGTVGSEEAPQRTDHKLREAAQELLRLGLLEASHQTHLYRVACENLDTLNALLEPLDLCAYIDEIRGLVYLAVLPHGDDEDSEADDWTHPLVRRQRLNLEQTLLVAILRQYFVAHEQESGTGTSEARVAVDELIPQLQLYLGDSGSEGQERSRVLQLLDKLKGHGLVSAPDAHQRVVIRPLIAHLANPDHLQALLNDLKARTGEADTASAKNHDGDA